MQPTIIVTDMSPSQLLSHSLERARKASAEIERLKHAPLAPGETIHDRALAVTVHAHALAEAFTIIDALASSAVLAVDERDISPSQTRPDTPSGHRGVHQEDDPSTN